eukprot:TRINITY_DN32858_c0_g1_i1.p1 TRINITY_DN32858_c0_g1~~TRINITY_DN32858_c0_g1_i1.p1  ORF type:complete len:293 (+),score=90.28 TRINITY_DN32858_c0_g1_i1:75-881(+)
MVAAASVSTKTTLLLVSGCVGASCGGLLIAAAAAGIYEWALYRSMRIDEEEERGRRRRRHQVKAADAGEPAEGDCAAPRILHATGTEVNVVAGPNQGKCGCIGKGGFCGPQDRYEVDIDGESWYIPACHLMSTAEPVVGAPVMVLVGANEGRAGVLRGKHEELDGLHKVELDATEECPAKVVELEKGEEGWPFQFVDDGKRPNVIAEASGDAVKAGLKPGMEIGDINGKPLGRDVISDQATIARALSSSSVTMTVLDTWWIHRDCFDC